MELEELKNTEIEVDDDIDFEDNTFVYEVWALGYDKDYNATDFELLVDNGYSEVAEAKKCFDYFKDINNFNAVFASKLPKNSETVHVTLVLEECLDDGETVECQDIIEEEKLF